MQMRLPSSGFVIESILSGLGASASNPAGGSTTDAVTEAEIGAALDAMARGDIEYVILEHGDQFLQAAGDGAGPYALEFRAGAAEGMIEVPGGVDQDLMRTVMLAYGRGDLGWRGALAWTPM